MGGHERVEVERGRVSSFNFEASFLYVGAVGIAGRCLGFSFGRLGLLRWDVVPATDE